MKLEVRVPDRVLGDVVHDISSLRFGQIEEVLPPGMENGSRATVRAVVPLSTMIGFINLVLNSLIKTLCAHI